ncbi:MAG: phosphoadenylyl-sulfate reductase [Bacteroidales bacterium]
MEATEIARLNETFSQASARELLRYCLERFQGQIALSSSLSLEDQVLTHMILSIDKSARIFTLDTGRLFPETLNLIERTSQHFQHPIEIFFPRHERVEEMVNQHGINLFYQSEALRKQCCQVRKLEPLARAFSGLKAWICGLRREQSVTRAEVDKIGWDAANGLVKINPLANWSEEETVAYIKLHNIPYNPLHDKNFPSIGCQPCTRAVEPGEDIRAGRWWWESPEHKECGLHQQQRKKDSSSL